MPPVIIYRLGSLGDTVVALPCFHKIADAFPDSRRLVLTNVPVSPVAPSLETILQPGGLIDGVIEYPVAMRSMTDLWNLRRRLKSTGATTLIYLAASRGRLRVLRDVCFFRLCGFSRIIGAPLTEDLSRNRRYPNGTVEREAVRLARTLHELGQIDLADPAAWDLCLSSAELQTAQQALSSLDEVPFFAVNMGGKLVKNDWGRPNWKRLMEELVGTLPAMKLAVVGAAQDAERADELLKLWPHGGLNLCGSLTPRECAGVLRSARFFIGHDTGPMHLAAAAQTPCVALFGNNNPPAKWHPYGTQHRAIHDIRGVDAITVEQVKTAVLSLATPIY